MQAIRGEAAETDPGDFEPGAVHFQVKLTESIIREQRFSICFVFFEAQPSCFLNDSQDRRKISAFLGTV